MATPFSPFVGRLTKPALKRRQSQLPSDLIDWDTPEIPELEKQKIIYEDHIKELLEDHEIDLILNEQIFQIANDVFASEYKLKVKQLEEELTKEKSKVNLMLGQIKMFEEDALSNMERIDEVEAELNSQRDTLARLTEEKDTWQEEKQALQVEIENLNFRNNETTCESNHNLELFVEKKGEADDLRRKLEAISGQLSHYKKLAKSRAHVE